MLRGILRWGPGYYRQRWAHPAGGVPAEHVLVCVADHFEPFRRSVGTNGVVRGGCTLAEAQERVQAWMQTFRQTVHEIHDADGKSPRHTFFYPWDEYEPPVLEQLATFCAEGNGEVEVHLHHRNDTGEGLAEKLLACRDTYAATHGLLGREDGQPVYSFVHGNWALCNSRPDGDWCGVAQEISVLRRTGCYMDLTYPSAPSPTQPPVVNRVYYGGDPAPGHCGHRRLAWVRVDAEPDPDGLLMVQGPLGLDFRHRKRGLLPRLENAELTEHHPPSMERFRVWCRIGIHVSGRPEWLIVKLHTHGLDTRSMRGVTGPAARAFYQQLQAACVKEGPALHFVTARELYNIIKAAEAGKSGNPAQWRDYRIAPPPGIRNHPPSPAPPTLPIY